MNIRFTASMLLRASILLLALVCGGLVWSTPSMATPPSSVCPGGTIADPITGVCWSSTKINPGRGGAGCLPGRLGLCLGALQNKPVPGAAIRPAPPAGPAPRKSWP